MLTLLWRDVAGVTELGRLLEKEGFLWCKRTKVSQQARSQRFLTFPFTLSKNDLSWSLLFSWYEQGLLLYPPERKKITRLMQIAGYKTNGKGYWAKKV